MSDGTYKSPFANTPAGKRTERAKKKPRKKSFFERLGERMSDPASDYLLDDDGYAVRNSKKK